MSVQLHRYTHETINTLSVRKLFSAVLAIYFTVWALIIISLTTNIARSLSLRAILIIYSASDLSALSCTCGLLTEAISFIWLTVIR